MARAKRTDRADARRRHRVTQVADAPTEVEDLESQASTSGDGADAKAPAAAPARSSSSAASKSAVSGQPAAASPARPSIFAAFKAAARPVDIRSDIAYLPTLILHTRAVWIPALAAVAAGVWFVLSSPVGSNGIANLAFQLFVYPPTIAGAFLAGILAPRATYMAGGIAALVGALVFAFVILVLPANAYTGTAPGVSPSPAASAAASAGDSGAPAASAAPSAAAAPAPSGSTGGTGTGADVQFDRTGAILQSLLISVPFGVAIGAFGGYYRRFLYASNPNRQRRDQERAKQKAQGRGDMKKRY